MKFHELAADRQEIPLRGAIEGFEFGDDLLDDGPPAGSRRHALGVTPKSGEPTPNDCDGSLHWVSTVCLHISFISAEISEPRRCECLHQHHNENSSTCR